MTKDIIIPYMYIYVKCSITAGASETVAHFVEYVSVVGGKAKTLVKALTKRVKS